MWLKFVFSLFVSPRHPKGRPYVPRKTRPIQIKIEGAPTTKGNFISTTGWDDFLIRGRVTGQVMKLSHFYQHGCKWTGFMCLNWLRPKSWLLQPKKGRPPIQTERSTSPHLRRSSWSWAPNYESLLLFHVSKSGLIPYLIRPLLVFELVINGRLHWYPFGMRCEHFHF